MSARQEAKATEIEAIRERFDRSMSAVLLDFKGLDVASVTELRVAMRGAGAEYRVVKNTLLRRAVMDTALDADDFTQHLAGQTAVAWSYEDPSTAAKVIKEFRKDEVRAEKLQVKCGVLDDAVLEAPRVESELATMPGKDEIRAMLLAQMMAPMQKLVMQLGAPAQNFAFALDARKRQQEGGA
jgi:large subunit ribosomal protein L10